MAEIPPEVLQALTEMLRPGIESAIREEVAAGILPIRREVTAMAGDVDLLAQLGGALHATTRSLQGHPPTSLPGLYERMENGNMSALIKDMMHDLRAGPPPPPHGMYGPGHQRRLAPTVVTPLPASAAPVGPPPAEASWSQPRASWSQAPPPPPAPVAPTVEPSSPHERSLLELLQSAARNSRRAHTNMKDAPDFPHTDYYVSRVRDRYLHDVRQFVRGIREDTNIGEARAIAKVFNTVPESFRSVASKLSPPQTMEAYETMITNHSAFVLVDFYAALEAFTPQGVEESVMQTVVRFMNTVVDKSKGFPPLWDRLNFHRREPAFVHAAVDNSSCLHLFWSYISRHVFHTNIHRDIAISMASKDMGVLPNGLPMDWSDREVWNAWCDDFGKADIWSLHKPIGRGTPSLGASRGPSASASPATVEPSWSTLPRLGEQDGNGNAKVGLLTVAEGDEGEEDELSERTDNMSSIPSEDENGSIPGFPDRDRDLSEDEHGHDEAGSDEGEPVAVYATGAVPEPPVAEPTTMAPPPSDGPSSSRRQPNRPEAAQPRRTIPNDDGRRNELRKAQKTSAKTKIARTPVTLTIDDIVDFVAEMLVRNEEDPSFHLFLKTLQTYLEPLTPTSPAPRHRLARRRPMW